MDAIRFNTNTSATLPARSSGSKEPSETFEWSTAPSLAMKAPPGARSTTVEAVRLETPQVAPSTPEAESKGTNWREIGKKTAMVLTMGGLGVVAPMVMPAVAQAAPAATVTTPVQVANIDEAVQNFRADHQLYVVGNPELNGQPLSQAQIAEFSQMLEGHPGSYVVLIDRTTDLAGDDHELSRGIGNSAAFQSVVNPETGEKEGRLLMIYFNVDNDPGQRKIFLRTEELPDRLNVGELNFADPDTGEPRELSRIFINAVRNEGKSVAGAADAVFDRIDSVVNAAVTQTTASASQAVGAAQTAVAEGKEDVQDFQKQHGAGGIIGSPDVASWDARLQQAQQQLQQRDYSGAARTANALVQTIEAQQQAMSSYTGAGATATQVQATLEEARSLINSLPNNEATAEMRATLARAEESMRAFRADYGAKNPDYASHLTAGQNEAGSALSQAQDYKSEQERNEKIRNYAAAGISVAILATGVILHVRARGARKSAEAEYDKAIAEIGQKSHQLLELMNEADFHKVANYEGKTRQLADALMENVTDALTLVGGAEKFAQEARSLIDAGGFGRVKNMFATGNFKKAERLLTDPNEKLSFNFTDSSRKVIEKGSHAETWRQELLQRGTSREFTQSLQEVLTAMADNRDEARRQLDELDKKSSEINGFIQRVDDASAATLKRAEALKAGKSPAVKAEGTLNAASRSSGEKYPQLPASALLETSKYPAPESDESFTAPAVVDNLLPRVRADQAGGGLLAKSRELADRNFISAWDDYTVPAERITNEATRIVELGEQGRGSLLPTVLAADAYLHPNEVKTDWAHAEQAALSDRLNETAHKAVRTSVDGELKQLSTDMTALETRVERVVEQDYERREISPKLIQDAEDDVATARQEIHAQLQGFGVFRSGTPDKVLVEPERNPSDRTEASHDHLGKVKPQLDQGNVPGAGEHLQSIRSLSQEAHTLVAESRAAVKSHHATLEERQGRTASTTQSIKSEFEPSLSRIKQTYAAVVTRLVAQELGLGDDVGDNIEQARADIQAAEKATASAIKHFDQAYVLTSRDELAQADTSLRSAQGHLDAIPHAEQHLGKKQAAVEGELRSLEGRFGQTRSNAGASYVRSQAKSLLAQAESSLRSANGAVKDTPRNPYTAGESLASAESSRVQTERAIEADHRAYEAAQSAIRGAESDVSSAESRIRSLGNESWSFSNRCGSAHTSVGSVQSAMSALGSASSEISHARSLVSSQRYEEAERVANGVSSSCSHAIGIAQSIVNSARAEHDRKVDRLEDQQRELERREAEERRRQEEAEAARRRAEEERRAAAERAERQEREAREARERQSSGSSGSRGGSSGGRGGSGSTGTGW